jgi:hypothetical protein
MNKPTGAVIVATTGRLFANWVDSPLCFRAGAFAALYKNILLTVGDTSIIPRSTAQEHRFTPLN